MFYKLLIIYKYDLQGGGQQPDLATSLMQLENAMRTLTLNPGKFDSLVAHLVDTISPFLEEANQCEEIFNLILQQVINLIKLILYIIIFTYSLSVSINIFVFSQ